MSLRALHPQGSAPPFTGPREALLKLRDKIGPFWASNRSRRRRRRQGLAEESEVNKAIWPCSRISLEGKPVIDVIARGKAWGKRCFPRRIRRHHGLQ